MTGPDASRIARSFARSFDSYHNQAQTQVTVAQDLAAGLAGHGAPRQFHNGFEIGCGTGHLTQALRKRFTFATLTLNDLTPEAEATARAIGARFLPGDALTIDWPEAPDLIASASTIQWLADPAALITRAAGALAPGGWLALSGFGPDQYHELSALGSGAQAPGLRSVANLAQAAHDAGLSVLEASDHHHKIWFKTPVEVLRHLRQTGVNSRASQVWSRTRLSQFCETYADRFGTDQGIPLTYHPTYLIARKG